MEFHKGTGTHGVHKGTGTSPGPHGMHFGGGAANIGHITHFFSPRFSSENGLLTKKGHVWLNSTKVQGRTGCIKVQGPRPDPLECIWGGGGQYRAHYSFFSPRSSRFSSEWPFDQKMVCMVVLPMGWFERDVWG